MVTYDQMGAPASSPAPTLAWVDASSPYSYASQLPGSTSTERWVLPSGGSGTVTQPATFVETYYHEYLVSSSFSIVNGGAPAPPALKSTALGVPAGVDMTSFTQTTWFDAGASYTFTSPLTRVGQSTNETWIGTVLVQTPNGHELSMDNNGTVIGPISITPVFYHQFFVGVKFNLVGGILGNLTAPAFTYQYFGNQTSVDNDTAVWVDSGTQYVVPENICCTNLNVERWEVYNVTSGTISSPTTISTTYFHQYFDSFSYSIVGAQPPSPSGQPGLTYIADGNAQHLTLLLTPQTFWADANSTYSATSTLAASGASERWSSPIATGSIIGPAPDNSVDIAYDQQYLVTMVGGGLPTEWLNAGNNATLVAPGVYGRSEGTRIQGHLLPDRLGEHRPGVRAHHLALHPSIDERPTHHNVPVGDTVPGLARRRGRRGPPLHHSADRDGGRLLVRQRVPSAGRPDRHVGAGGGRGRSPHNLDLGLRAADHQRRHRRARCRPTSPTR